MVVAALTRLTTHVALVAALSGPISTPPAVENVLSLVASGVSRSDPALTAAVKSLLVQAPAPAPVSFADAAGSWRVVNAPHIDTLSKLALTTFSPIEYRISSNGAIASFVRYDSQLFGSGWLCTDGTIDNVAADVPTVRIVWDRVWWKLGGDDVPPVDPEVDGNAFLGPLVQAIGKAGFIESLSVFPVRYLDADVGIFNFQSFTVTAKRG